ncbi:hypothetical protein [Streptomyces sp. NPDC051662]|uniref:hypothetical protein n=1 Tax=Streptomyces sp. NPDC051662 TaxID=3154750 RepID=UPI00342F6EE2
MDTAIELKRSKIQAHAGRIGRALCEVLNSGAIEGGGWSHRVDKETYYLSLSLFHPRGLELSLRHQNTHLKGDAGRRLTVAGVYPSGYGGLTADKITVGVGTRASHMASRIVTHLLPDYLKYLDVALAEERQAQQDRRARRLMNHHMKLALPALHPAGWETEQSESSRNRSFWYASSCDNAYPPAYAGGEVRLSTDASEAEIKLNRVPAALALRILGLLNPNPAVEGIVMPRGIAPKRRALSTVRIISGEVLPPSVPRTAAPEPAPQTRAEATRQ